MLIAGTLGCIMVTLCKLKRNIRNTKQNGRNMLASRSTFPKVVSFIHKVLQLLQIFDKEESVCSQIWVNLFTYNVFLNCYRGGFIIYKCDVGNMRLLYWLPYFRKDINVSTEVDRLKVQTCIPSKSREAWTTRFWI